MWWPVYPGSADMGFLCSLSKGTWNKQLGWNWSLELGHSFLPGWVLARRHLLRRHLLGQEAPAEEALARPGDARSSLAARVLDTPESLPILIFLSWILSLPDGHVFPSVLTGIFSSMAVVFHLQGAEIW